MPISFPDPINLPLAGIVDAAGELTIEFGPPANQWWSVSQVTVEMPTAPAGATVNLRYFASLIAPAPSARRAAASGDPPITLQGGEIMRVEWENCTPGDVGTVLAIYRKTAY